MTHPLAVRARVVPVAEPPFEPLYERLLEDQARGGALASTRLPARWPDTRALSALGEAKRSPLPPALAADLGELHRRLGASSRSLDALEALASGAAVCTIAGQQPAPLGGPLYAFHKIASAVALARRFEARTGIACVPAFWMHGEDSDFVEIRSATVADADLTLHDVAIAEDAHPEGGLVGNIPSVALSRVDAEALAFWQGLPFAGQAAQVLTEARAQARDLGEAHAALVLHMFADQGVVVIDPRLAAFRTAAREIIDRYLSQADRLHDLARDGGAAVETVIGHRPLTDATLESFVFAVTDGVRHKVAPADARGASLQLTPNVVLRPVVQDGVLPTVAMACGPGETAYLAQLREVFEALAVHPAVAVPRLAVTWLPRTACDLAEAAGVDAVRVVTETDAVIRGLAERSVPDDVMERLDRARSRALEGLDDFSGASARIDPSFPQMVSSARGKVDYQFQRLRDGLIGKARHRLERQNPEWVRLRYYLLPGDRPQERRLASMEPFVHRGPRVIGEMCDLADAHAEALEQGRFEHLLVEL